METDWQKVLVKHNDNQYRIPRTFRDNMNVDGMVYVNEILFNLLLNEAEVLTQVVNVATLPGIQRYSIAMPDIHFGYGFPIGGVAATSMDNGIISPGGVGFDINCGVRLLKTNFMRTDVLKRTQNLSNRLFSSIPCGVGSRGDLRLNPKEIINVLLYGAKWVVDNGYGDIEDLENCEENGCMKVEDVGVVSSKALERGSPQLGTLGSGNHFLEVQYVAEIFDKECASVMEIEEQQIVVMLHSGSRGLGYQVCTDFITVMQSAVRKYGIDLPDKQLGCAPIDSEEGRQYFSAMAASANFAWANRQYLAHLTRQVFADVFGKSVQSLGMTQIYDVAHNIAKFEEHILDGVKQKLCVHRKGATRAFAPAHPDVPRKYANIGQPVIVPGDMGRASFLLVGTDKAMQETFGSVCHGAGRVKSRTSAMKSFTSADILDDLSKKGIIVKAVGKKTIVEEAPMAYKDVSLVVDTCAEAGLVKKVAMLKPIIVIKG